MSSCGFANRYTRRSMDLSVVEFGSRVQPLARWLTEIVLAGAMIGCTAMRSPAAPEAQVVATPAQPEAPAAPSEDSLAGWLTARLPKGGALTSRPDGTIAV